MAILSPLEIRRILRNTKNDMPVDDFRLIDSWAEYKDKKGCPDNERPLDYLCYEIEVIDPSTGEKQHLYKALRFLRITRLPKSAKESTSFMDMQEQILTSVYENQFNLVTVIANIIEPTPLGLLFLYGVQGVGHTLDEAKEVAHSDFIGLTSLLTGTFRVLHYREVHAQETEWLREKMYSMDYMTMVRGIPKANKGGEDAGNKGIGGKNLNPGSQGTMEEIIAGMVDHEYVIQVLSSPVRIDTLKGWQTRTQLDMTQWNGQLQGTKAISASLSMPMMYMANASQSQGWNQAYTDAESVNYSTGENFSTGYGESIGESLSQTFGQSFGRSQGISVSDSVSHSQSVSVGQSAGQSFGVSNSVSNSLGTSNSVGTSQSLSKSLSESIGLNKSVSNSISQGTSVGQSNTSTIGRSEGNNWSNGWNQSNSNSSSETHSDGTNSNSSTTIGSSTSNSNNKSYTSGTTIGNSESTGKSNTDNMSSSVLVVSGGSTVGHSSTQTSSDSVSNSATIGSGETNGTSHSGGYSIGTNHSDSLGTSTSSSHGTSGSTGGSVTDSFSQSVGNSITNSVTSGYSESIGESRSVGFTNGASFGVSSNQGVSQSAGTSSGQSLTNSLTNSVTNSNGVTTGRSVGTTQSVSATESASQGTSQSATQSTNVSTGRSTSQGTSLSKGLSAGTSGMISTGSGGSMGLGPSIGYNKSYQWLDQQVKDILELLEFQNERIKYALRGSGAFYTYVYIACPTLDALSAAQALAKSTWQNEYAMVQPVQVINLTEEEQRHLLYHFAAFSADVTRENVFGAQEYKYSTVLLPKEFVAYTHLPRISEGGIYAEVNDVPKFAVPSQLSGEIYMGNILSAERYSMKNGYNTPYAYRISERELMHGIVTGASRSGKTVAAMRFIAELSQVRRSATGKRLRIVCMDPKQDWRGLARFVEPERFRFYSMGNPNFHALHFNPCKIPYGVMPQIWVDVVIEVYCRAYGLLERGKQLIAETFYTLYENAGVFDAFGKPDWQKNVPELSKQVTFTAAYNQMTTYKKSMEDGTSAKGRSGNDTKDAYARLLERLSAFGREFSIEHRLFGTSDGLGIDDLIGADDVTILESKGLENTFRSFIFGVITAGFYRYAIGQEKGYLAPDQYETVLVIEEANEVLTGSDTAGTSKSNIGLSGQSEFEQMLDQSAGYGLFIFAITQRISDMPTSIIANCGLIFAGKVKMENDIKVIVKTIGREERYDDREIAKWFPRSPTGWFVCQSSRTTTFIEAEPVMVQISMLNISPPTNAEIDEILMEKEAKEKVEKQII